MSKRVATTLSVGMIVGGSLGSSAAALSLPSPMWAEVERVVIACHFDASISSRALRQALCEQILEQADQLTSYPVSMAGPRDLTIDADRLPVQDRQLIVHVEAAAASGGQRPGEVTLTVRPERVGLKRWRGSATGPVTVKVDWAHGAARLRGPIRPLALFLMEPRRNRNLPLRLHPVRGGQ